MASEKRSVPGMRCPTRRAIAGQPAHGLRIFSKRLKQCGVPCSAQVRQRSRTAGREGEREEVRAALAADRAERSGAPMPCPSHRTPQAMLPGVPSRWRAADPASTRRASQSAAHLTAPRPPARRRPRAPPPPRRRRRPRSRRSGPAHAPVCAPCCQRPRPTAAPRAAAPARGPRPAQQPQGRVAIPNPTLHNSPSASLRARASWTRHRGTRPCLQSGRSVSSMSDKHSAPNASAGRGWHGGVQPRRGAPGRPLSWARAGTAGRGAARLAQALNGAYGDAAQDVAQDGHVL